MPSLIFDTNFLVYAAKYKLFHNLETLGYKFIILDKVIVELERISKNKKKKLQDREAAILAMEIIKKWVKKGEAKYLKTKKNVDEAILDFSKENDVVVATMDSELKKKLKAQNKKVIIVRQKKLIVEEY
ncbi:MAG: ribonuclease VapC [Candidatus Pacearchaeota archaeon]|nr:ribonuclease VapC [Candidatus Pacearchaeota archaeon]